jgi:hypothetical protein
MDSLESISGLLKSLKICTRSEILEQSMGDSNQVGIGFVYHPARLHRLAESFPGLSKSLTISTQAELIQWNWFLGSLNV